ncbi:hypothetical protein SK128_022040 [Halocaridina rubra]|uniref:Ig-like domain-containing protein n=1 Tax=Halocaridina rubra TaxID=373956 RepID=A0AAN8WSE3_HALRR
MPLPGFERHVPGYPRYSYFGDADKGEHHLIIKGVTLEDDGEYQCQVGPTMTTGAIWAAANVTVMVAPASVIIVGHEPDSEVEVVVGSTIQLQCVVQDARPAPSVAWYRDGLLLDQGLQEDRIKSTSHPRLFSVVSRLSLKISTDDDGQQYSCRALHPTLRDARTSLVTSVTLSVLHPPGAPIITGYKTGEVLQAGDKRTLTCRVMGGNPRPWLTWYWHGWDTDNKGEKGSKRKTIMLKEKDVVRKGKKGKSVLVTHQMTASRAEDGVVYECRVTSNQLDEPLTTNISLTVHYAPARVMVTGSSAVAAGKPYSLTCSTSPANPPATLTWLIDGKRVKNEKTDETQAEGSGWITSSELTQYASRSLEVRQVKVQCEATHPTADSPITHTRLISITSKHYAQKYPLCVQRYINAIP